TYYGLFCVFRPPTAPKRETGFPFGFERDIITTAGGFMKDLIPIDLKDIVESVKAEGKGRRVLWQDSESLAFLSSGRRERKDFHIDPSDEVTLQLSGVQNLVYLTPEGKQQTAFSKDGQMLLCPGGVPHSPRAEENSWCIVFEHKRSAGEKDLIIWLCAE